MLKLAVATCAAHLGLSRHMNTTLPFSEITKQETILILSLTAAHQLRLSAAKNISLSSAYNVPSLFQQLTIK